jgi:hypothetical protein
MLAEGTLDPGAVRVDFYGPVEIDTASVEQALDRFALHDVVTFHSSVSRQQCLDILGRADVLLLLQTDDLPWALPAKNFEYLATGNEILLLSGPYELATFLEPYDNVHRANPRDVPAIKACIARIVDRLRSGTADRERNLASLSPLYKRALTREFARLLDTVVATDQPARDR